jgi:hypothetical protein
MPVRSAPTVSDAVIDAVKLEMTMSAVNRPAELLGIAPSLEHPDQPPDHEQQRRQGGHHLKKRERKELLDHRQPAAVPIGRHGDAEPRDVERMTEVHDDLALGRHGDRRDRGVELPGLDPREQARQVRLPQLERVAELLGEAVPEIDADAAPRAVGVLDGEGRRLLRADDERAVRRRRLRSGWRRPAGEPASGREREGHAERGSRER